MVLWLLATGLISILGQVVLLRELNVAFFGSELVYILALGVWLCCTAGGAALGRRGFLPSGAQVRLLLAVAGLVLPAGVVFVRRARLIFGDLPGAYLPFPSQLLAMVLALLPIGVLLGLLFQWAAKRYVTGERTLAAAYAIESAGGLAGGVLATLFLKWGVQNFTAALLCGLISLAAACWPWRRERPWWLAATVAAGTVVLAGGLAGGPDLDHRLTRWNHPALLATRDTPYGRVTMNEAAGQLSVFLNDALVFESEGTGAEEFVHLAAVQHVRPDSILILGGGGEGLVREALGHGPAGVDYVELDLELLYLFRRHLPDLVAATENPAVRVIHADPRRFLRSGSRYDLILVGMPEPASAQANRFFTREFFARCAGRLRPRGLLAFRLPAAENLWTAAETRRAASIHRALAAVFADVVVLPGTTSIVLASTGPLTRQVDILAARLHDRRLDTRLVSGAYLDYLYTNDRFAGTAALLAGAEAPENRDGRPICYQYTLLLWLARFFPVAAWLQLPEMAAADLLRSPVFWLVAAGAGGLLLLCRRRERCRLYLLVAGAGFLGMVLETALVLQYQVTSGVLFQDLGLLLTMFMAGLAAGAWTMDRGARAGRPPRRVGFWLLMGFVGLNVLVARLIGSGWSGGLVATSVLLFGGGFLVAAVFAFASLYRREDQRRVISPLYAADLLGGCLGSVAGSLFLIPVLGTGGSAWLMAVLAAGALLLV